LSCSKPGTVGTLFVPTRKQLQQTAWTQTTCPFYEETKVKPFPSKSFFYVKR
jgi:hypothetical protein